MFRLQQQLVQFDKNLIIYTVMYYIGTRNGQILVLL